MTTTALDELRTLVAGLTPDQLAGFLAEYPDHTDVVLQVTEDLAAAHWRADPASMAAHLTRNTTEPYQRWPYVELLSRKFVDAVEGRSPRQIWNLPPQHGKSKLTQWGVAWALARHPNRRYVLTAYGDDLAVRNALAVRDILSEHAAELHTELRRDQRRQDRFTTSVGGGVLAASIDGGITGWAADGIVIDDPFKGWPEAHSENMRAHVFNQYRFKIRTRQTSDDFWIILVMTRAHEHDLAGQLLDLAEGGNGEAWELVRIPEVAEAHDPDSLDPFTRMPDPLGRAPGELLGRFTAETVAGRRLGAGPYLWAGVHQQRPAPEEGGEIKRDWWRIDDAVPPRFDEAISSWDMKLKQKETGDFVVGQAWGRNGSGMWCYDQLRGRWDQPTVECALALISVRHPEISRHYVENTGNGPEVMEALRAAHPGYVVSPEIAKTLGMTDAEREAVALVRQRGMQGLIPVPVKGSKIVRARAVTGRVEAGDVHLAPAKAGWIPIFVEEHASFPNGSHDDQVDAMSQALAKLSRGPAQLTVHHGEVPRPDPRQARLSPPNGGRVLVPTTQIRGR